MQARVHDTIVRPLTLLAAAFGLLAVAPSRASAQNLYVANNFSAVSEYNISTGAPVANPLVNSGLSTPLGIALANNILYAANYSGNTVTAYNATTGAAAAGFTTINTGNSTAPWDVVVSGGMLYVSTYGGRQVSAYNAATGAPAPGFTTATVAGTASGMAISGTTLYVGDTVNTSIHTYNALTGALINNSFVTGLFDAAFLTVAGNTLYVSSDRSTSTVRAFNATTGAAMPGFTTITGLNSPEGVKVVGNDLLVAVSGSNLISRYDATTGTLINANFITGVSSPFGIAVPEPSAWALLGICAAGAGIVSLRRRQSRQS